MKSFKIAGRIIGQGQPCLIIAEVAQAHEGSLGMAHAYIDAIAGAGADAVKFQTHIAAAESTPAEPWRVKFSLQDQTRYDYWRRMEFSEDQWLGLKQHADKRGLMFFSSPFSTKAAEMLQRIGMPAWKVPSGEISNWLMLDQLIATKNPILLSTGMSSLDEVDAAVERIVYAGVPFAIFQCTSAYPCPPEKIGLNLISDFRQQYQCPVGLSDHSGKIYPGLAAATVGVNLLEVHVSFSRKMFGPDVNASLTMSELAQQVEGIRYIEKMQAHPVDKSQMALDMRPLRDMFTKSIIVCEDLAAGTVLKRQHLTAKKPGTGIPVRQIEEIIGRRIKKALTADTLLSEDLLEDPET